tara:strand:- start:1001 stop:1789 length:789 start_codon:yes stop_codon:yes gene_type:complete
VGIAQLVERWIVTPEVVGSKPSIHLMFLGLGSETFSFCDYLNDAQSLLSLNLLNNLVDVSFYDNVRTLTPLQIFIDKQVLTSLNNLPYVSNFSEIIIAQFNHLELNTIEVEVPTTFYAVSGDKTFDNYHDYALHRLDLELTRRQKRRPDLTKDQIFELMNGLDSDSIAYTLEEIENEPAPDTSNIFKHKGQEIDVTKLSKDEIFHYLVTIDETPELMNLEHVRTMFHVATPNEMLHYPEPFTASPSFIHEDLHFLHILHYQF